VVLRTPEPVAKSTGTLIEMSHRLRPRDYAIASLLHQHTTLTTDQLTAILFTNPITCRHRLNTLRSFGFVDRFIRRNHPGAPNLTCWVPGPLSARLTALSAGENPPTARALRERQDRIYANPTLDHLIATNWFFIKLLADARSNPQTSLLRWWSERTTAAAFGQRIHPDGHGVWTDGNRQVGFFLELDRGTEFSGGQSACQSRNLHVCAGQRLMSRRYRLQHVWCKHIGGVSSACPAVLRAWGRCRGGPWGRFGRPSRDEHSNRPVDDAQAAACGQGWSRVGGPERPFKGLPDGG